MSLGYPNVPVNPLASSTDYGTIAVQAIQDDLPDTMALQTKLWQLLLDNKKYIDGGTYISEGIRVAENPNPQFIAGDGSSLISLNPYAGLIPAYFQWKFYAISFATTFYDDVVTNNTDKSIINMHKEKVEETEATVIRQLTQSAWGSASTNALNFNGIADIVAASGTAYGGLTDTQIDAQYGKDARGSSKWLAELDTTTAGVNLFTISNMLTRLQAKAQQTGSMTKWDNWQAITNPEVFNALRNAHQSQQYFTDVRDVKVGFKSIELNMGLTVSMDAWCPGSGYNSADNWFLIFPVDAMKLAYKYGFDKEKKSSFDADQMMIPNAVTKNYRALAAGNIITKNRRVIGCFKNLNPRQAAA